MQYFKVMKDDKVIDVLNENEICYLKYSKKHGRMFNAKNINDAQAIFSSDQRYIWHVNTLLSIPVEGYDTVTLVPIDVYEYDQLKRFNFSTPEELIDNFVMMLVEGGLL